MFGLSQSFSDKSNLIILVDVQGLHENGKWILRIPNGFYILFKTKEAILLLHTVLLNYFIRVKAS